MKIFYEKIYLSHFSRKNWKCVRFFLFSLFFFRSQKKKSFAFESQHETKKEDSKIKSNMKIEKESQSANLYENFSNFES